MEHMRNFQDKKDNISRKETSVIARVLGGIPPGWDIWLVALLSAGALLPVWLSYDIVSRDAAHLYIPVAKLFLEGKYLEAVTGSLKPLLLPLYEILIFSLAKISGFELETSGRLISFAGFVIGALGLYKVSDLLFKNRAINFISVLFFVSNRDLLIVSVDCLKESLLVCLILWANYFILKGVSSPARLRYFGAGLLLFMLGGMVRSVSVIFLLSWLIVWVFHEKQGIMKRGLLLVLPAAALFLIAYIYHQSPWMMLLFRRSYNVTLLFSSNIDLSDRLTAAIHFIRQLLARSYYLIGLFSFMGIIRKRHEPYPIHISIALCIFFIIGIGVGWDLTNLGSDRFLLVFIVWLYPIAAFAVNRSLESGNKVLKVLAILLLVISPVLWAGKALRGPDPDKLARKDAGKWILAHSGPGKNILTNRERIAFYAQGRWYVLQDGKEQRIFEKITGKKSQAQGTQAINRYMQPRKVREIVAIDTELESGKILYEAMNSGGILPDKVFRSIIIYLP